ncbi:PH domain-containing protein [Oceanobacillus polygoni]|uniref:Membrane protein YdbS with pleckstrin-like domain n=1 Tax=Oceanobacillus polygoni TaxID=1235259 RepID=A0A9X0Z2L9_9BACI|nr:PH domain-containing protein [Oceanobacillus polygoni]MBP2079816.1 membrane protein YdbS with pleckstrin-like domain [Oceanobacillus polygoni]
MRQPPMNTIAPDAIKAWKLTGAFYESILWLITIAAWIIIYMFKWPYWIGILLVIISILSTFLTVLILPKLRFRKWRYELFEQEIYIQHGILIMSRTLIPMIRVQHVDTKQGPFLKKYQLASVTISTAATTHEIPALREEDASALRDRISALARVDEDDV